MEIIKLKKYKNPSYPLKDEVLCNPILLKKLPERWKKKAITCATMSSAALLFLTACRPTTPLGGAIMSPIVTLSEEDALIIINDEAKKQGINFIKDNTEIKDIDIPYKQNFVTNSYEIESKKSNLTLDGYNSDQKIGFEYVSDEDMRAWTIGNESPNSFYSNKQVATALSDNIKIADKEKQIGVFFDPKSVDQITAEAQIRNQVVNFITYLKAEGII